MTNITANTQPTVAAIVPARNEEATISQCVESLAQQPEITEIVVINDQSTDRTVKIVLELMRKHARLRLIEATPLPPRWVGKNHAVWQGSRTAKDDWLLFTDADVLHEKHSVSRALEIASEQNASLVSFSPKQITESWYEKSLIPAIYCRLAKKFSFERVNDPQNKSAAANGQFLLISRAAYDAVGGHASIASEVLEDVALAQRVKQAGYRIWFGSGQGSVRVRMYRTFAAMWEGWKKNLYRLMGADPASTTAEIAIAMVPILVGAAIVVTIAILSRDWLPTLIGAVIALAVWHLFYSRELAANQFSRTLTCYGLPGKFLYAAVLWASYRSYQKGSLWWKGREYPVGTPHASNDAAKR